MSGDGRNGYPTRFAEQVSLGLVPGVKELRKFGMNSAVPSGTSELWTQGTLRILPAAAGVVSVSSSSVEDDTDKGGAVPGTGMFTMRIEGLDANYLEIFEDVTLNGTATVTTTLEFLRVNRMFGITAGTSGINVGNITATIGGDPQAFIETLQGQTHQTHYTVPAGKTFVVTDYAIGVGRMAGSTDCHVLGQIKVFGTTCWRSVTDIFLWDGGNHDNHHSVTAIPEKTELRQRIISTTTTQAHGIVGGYLINNSILATM